MTRRPVIHGHLISTWTRTVAMTCVEKGIDYEIRTVRYGGADHHAMQPFGRIPILETGGRRIYEALAICGHLDESFPGPTLQPDDPDARTRMRMWMSICADYLFRGVVRTIPRDRPATAEERSSARSLLERADALIGKDPYLAGGQITLADLYLAPQLANCCEKAPQLLDGLNAINTWSQRIEARESFARTTRR